MRGVGRAKAFFICLALLVVAAVLVAHGWPFLFWGPGAWTDPLALWFVVSPIFTTPLRAPPRHSQRALLPTNPFSPPAVAALRSTGFPRPPQPGPFHSPPSQFRVCCDDDGGDGDDEHSAVLERPSPSASCTSALATRSAVSIRLFSLRAASQA